MAQSTTDQYTTQLVFNQVLVWYNKFVRTVSPTASQIERGSASAEHNNSYSPMKKLFLFLAAALLAQATEVQNSHNTTIS